jgi:ribonuclease HII
VFALTLIFSQAKNHKSYGFATVLGRLARKYYLSAELEQKRGAHFNTILVNEYHKRYNAHMADEQTIVGIDEAGRGPLAGPVYVGLAAACNSFDFTQFPTLTDSKQMSEADRERIYNHILEGDNKVEYTIRYSTPQVIDKQGINPAINRAINRGLRNLDISTDNSKLLLDGGLSAPAKYRQESITKGDAKEPVISLASVLAKVARDKKMRRLAKKHPQYGFEKHKGYGTNHHRRKINKFGVCDIHRKSFL